jgi:hypothetical protein
MKIISYARSAALICATFAFGGPAFGAAILSVSSEAYANNSVSYWSGFSASTASNNYTPGDVVALRLDSCCVGPGGAGIVSYGAAMAARADYGTLGVAYGIGMEHPFDNYSWFMSSLVKAESRDVVTITSNTLAAGTPVSVTLTARVHVPAEISQPYTPTVTPPIMQTETFIDNTFSDTFVGELRLSANLSVPGFGSVCWSASDPTCQAGTSDADQIFRWTRIVRVGDTIELNPTFEAYGSILSGKGRAFVGFQGLGTANTYLSFDDVGVTAVAESGYDYTAPAGTLSVPEPATWAMMLFGFGLVGFAMRQRPKIHKNVSFA